MLEGAETEGNDDGDGAGAALGEMGVWDKFACAVGNRRAQRRRRPGPGDAGRRRPLPQERARLRLWQLPSACEHGTDDVHARRDLPLTLAAPMIGQSLPEYIFIRCCIFCLRLIAPLSIAYVAASHYTGDWIYSRWLGYYAYIEALFYVLVYLPRSYWLQKVSSLGTL